MEAEVSVAETAEERAISRRVGCMFLTTAATLAATVSYNPYVQTLVSVTPMLSGCDAESETEEGAEEGETCSLCFAAGTPVHTNHGDVPIEKVHVGEEVEARDSATGREEYEPVTSLVPGHPDRLVEVRVAGERQPLRASVGHPFWVERDDATAGTWIAAGQLRLGDRLLTMKGEWRAITAITPVTGEVTVYNFTVAKDHDYFVGETGFLVHNESCPICRVGRWMSPQELELMQAEGRVQESFSEGVTSVTVPPNPTAWNAAGAGGGSVFAEFDVPSGSVMNISPNGWGKIYGPNSIFGPKLGITEMPPATNIKVPCLDE